MKRIKVVGWMLLGSLGLFLLTASLRVQAQPGQRVSLQLFYDHLAPYGEWVNDPQYGYIWLPDAGPDFMPYASNGHWVMTSYGNTWVSHYEWGWAPFHYGRWVHTDWYGWAWVPGYEWGPAWVSWRSGGGYFGWAPLGPRMNISIHVRIPSHHWVFVPQRYITSPRINRYYVAHRHYGNVYNRTTIINNTYIYNNRTYVSGPSRQDLERATRSRVQVREIHNASRPTRVSVNERSVNMYRPSVDERTRSTARPTRVADAESVRSRAVASSTRSTQRTEAAPTSSRSTQRTEATRATQQRTEAAPASSRSTQRTQATRAAQQRTEAAPASSRSTQRTEATRATQRTETSTRSTESNRENVSSRRDTRSSTSSTTSDRRTR